MERYANQKLITNYELQNILLHLTKLHFFNQVVIKNEFCV